MKVLVTGGTGFIGSHLIERLLAKGETVRVIAKDCYSICPTSLNNLDVIIQDINQEADWESILSEIDMVYHLAGITRAQRSKDYYYGNYEATKRLVALCQMHCQHLSRFVYVSSLSATGPCRNGSSLDENTECHPVSDYGRSKMLAEKAVMGAADSLPVVIVRPSAVYGPRDRDMYEYFKLILLGIHPVIGFQKKYLNLIHVNDLVEGILLAGEKKSAINEVFFLGSEKPYTNEEIGMAIAKAACASARCLHIPHSFIYLLGFLLQSAGMISKRPIFFNIQKAREAVQTAWNCSIEKAENILGFEPKISLADGMFQTYRWYKENHWLI
ncbi:MAG: NAD(P)-dependent oxidoreductase [Calditrichales bacterium]|nr:MAG: NAD(P)-dependent oxidoreductase [Calditrichales bacterium]